MSSARTQPSPSVHSAATCETWPQRRPRLRTGRCALPFLAVLGALLLVGAVAVPESQGYELGGKKWPVRAIKYHVAAPKYEKAISEAVRAWNSSGVDIKFKPAASKRRAMLRIRQGDTLGDASATVGYVRRRFIRTKTWNGAEITGPVECGQRLPGSGSRARVKCGRYLQVARVTLGPRASLSQIELAGLVTHELGHVLGLEHENQRCAQMSLQVHCDEPPEGFFRCRLLERDDVRGAIRRYGGQMAPLTPEFCPLP